MDLGMVRKMQRARAQDEGAGSSRSCLRWNTKLRLQLLHQSMQPEMWASELARAIGCAKSSVRREAKRLEIQLQHKGKPWEPVGCPVDAAFDYVVSYLAIVTNTSGHDVRRELMRLDRTHVKRDKQLIPKLREWWQLLDGVTFPEFERKPTPQLLSGHLSKRMHPNYLPGMEAFWLRYRYPAPVRVQPVLLRHLVEYLEPATIAEVIDDVS